MTRILHTGLMDFRYERAVQRQEDFLQKAARRGPQGKGYPNRGKDVPSERERKSTGEREKNHCRKTPNRTETVQLQGYSLGLDPGRKEAVRATPLPMGERGEKLGADIKKRTHGTPESNQVLPTD